MSGRRASKSPSNKILPREEVAITDADWMQDCNKSDDPKGIDPSNESKVNMNLLLAIRRHMDADGQGYDEGNIRDCSISRAQSAPGQQVALQFLNDAYGAAFELRLADTPNWVQPQWVSFSSLVTIIPMNISYWPFYRMARAELTTLNGAPTYKWMFATRPDGISHEIKLWSRAFSTVTAGCLLPRSVQKERTQLPQALCGWDRAGHCCGSVRCRQGHRGVHGEGVR